MQMENGLKSANGTEAIMMAGLVVNVAATFAAQIAMTVVELFFVARLGVDALAGVSIALTFYVTSFLFCLGIVTAVTPLASAAFGAARKERVKIIGQQGVLIGLLVTIPFAIVLPLIDKVSILFGGETKAGLLAAEYLQGAAPGLPIWVAYVAIRSLAFATGKSSLTTIVMVLAIPVHAGLTYLLTFGGLTFPPLGVFGAGLAYAFTGAFAVTLLAVWGLATASDTFGQTFSAPYRFDLNACHEIMALGLPFSIRIVLREGVMPMVSFLLIPFGTATLAAHAIVARVADLAGAFAFGTNSAVNVRVGHGLGRLSLESVQRSVRVGACIAIMLSMLVGAAVILNAASIARVFLPTGDIAAVAAVVQLLLPGAMLILVVGIQAPIAGALNGMKDARAPLFMAIASQWLVGIPAGFVLSRVLTAPAVGMWLGLITGELSLTAFYVFRLRALVECMRATGLSSGATDGQTGMTV
jgi:MATE family multidrug resistance protein